MPWFVEIRSGEMKGIILLTALFVGTGCVSTLISKAIPQKGIQVDEVKRVKSVAIIAFDVLEYKPTGLAGKISGHVTSMQTAGNVKETDSEFARDLYGDLANTL